VILGVTTLPGSLDEAQRLFAKRLVEFCGGILVCVGSRYAVPSQPFSTLPPDTGQVPRWALGWGILFHTLLVCNSPVIVPPNAGPIGLKVLEQCWWLLGTHRKWGTLNEGRSSD